MIMMTSASSRAHRLLVLLFVCALSCIGMAPGAAWAVDGELTLGSIASVDNGIPVLSLTIDPEEFQKVIQSPDHSYRAECGSISIM